MGIRKREGKEFTFVVEVWYSCHFSWTTSSRIPTHVVAKFRDFHLCSFIKEWNQGFQIFNVPLEDCSSYRTEGSCNGSLPTRRRFTTLWFRSNSRDSCCSDTLMTLSQSPSTTRARLLSWWLEWLVVLYFHVITVLVNFFVGNNCMALSRGVQLSCFLLVVTIRDLNGSTIWIFPHTVPFFGLSNLIMWLRPRLIWFVFWKAPCEGSHSSRIQVSGWH